MGDNLPEITVVIPCREPVDASITLDSLAKQTYQGFKTVVVPDGGLGANWARNHGFMQCDTEFVLFSDDDIEWKSHALETLLRTLKMTKASWSYGRFIVYGGTGPEQGTVWANEPWDPYLLKDHNYISTMSLIRAKDFPGFDERIQRLQDWDLWLTMVEQGKRGVYCNDLIFTTKIRPGITHGGPDVIDSENIVRRKHGLKELTFAVSTMPKP